MIRIALIPSYEPDEKLVKLVKELHQNKLTIVVIDDGSGDNYKMIYKECMAYSKVISYKENRGKGYALRTGLKYIKEFYNNYIVVTMDSDGQHKVRDAIKLIEEIENGKDCLILGKRPRSNKIPIKSRIGNAVTRKIFNIVTFANIYDTQTGLRAFSNNLIDYMLSIEGDRYEYEMNVLLNARKNKIKMEEIEVETIYIDNNKGSHFNPLKDSIKIYKEIIKYSMSSIISFFIDFSLFSLLALLFNNDIFSNILARFVSGTVNYSLNNSFVFNSEESKRKSIIKYICLAILILILNTILLKSLIIIGVNKFAAKLLTEIVLFVFSWIIQKKFIFK